MSTTSQDSPSPEFWQKRLASWLGEWEVFNKLRKADETAEENSETTKGESINARELITQCNKPIQVGDLRLLSRRLIGETDMPAYVAVISDWEKGHWLIAPYGQLSEPATTGELLTERSDFGLRVLCLWNAHTISSEDLSFSWLEDRLTEKEIEESWAVFRCIATGEDLPPNLLRRTGPPITHPEDPRIAYQEECRQMFTPIRELWGLQLWWHFKKNAPHVVAPEEPAEFSFEMIQFHQTDALAASSKLSPNQKIFRVKGTSLQLIVQFVPDSNEICFSLLDDGKPSGQMDGYQIYLKSGGERALKLDGGQANVALDSDSIDFRLIDPNGKVVELIDEEEQ